MTRPVITGVSPGAVKVWASMTEAERASERASNPEMFDTWAAHLDPHAGLGGPVLVPLVPDGCLVNRAPAGELANSLEPGFLRNGLVTRSASATGGTTCQEPAPFFVDWLTISQAHFEGGLPIVDSGCVMAVDTSGELEWKTSKAVKHEGSFETSLNVRSDGHRVTFSGNVSRFGRSNNLFGFDFFECLQRINAVLATYGLPPFTAGQKMEFVTRGDVRIAWTGARVSRIDLTSNYETGSADNAHAFMQYLGTQHTPRQEGRVLGQGETVAFGGTGRARQYWKAYIKHLEMLRHSESDQKVIDYCAERGIVRFEGTVRSKALTDMGCAYLGDYESGWAMSQLIQLFHEKSQVLHRAERSTDDLDDLPRPLRATARDYLAGMDCAAIMSRRTFYRHRAQLLPSDFKVPNPTVTAQTIAR